MTSDRVDLSILILTRDRWPLLERCLRSLHGQAQDAGIPVVVLVNGSDDGSAARVRTEFPDVTVHESDVNLGCPGGRNRLTELVGSEWVVHVDDDGTVGPDFLRVVLAEVAQAPADRAVVTGRFVDLEMESADILDSGPTGTFCGGVCIIRRSDFRRVGGYPEDGLRQGEEAELSLKLHDQGSTVHRAGALIVFHPRNPDARKRRELLRTGFRQSLLTGVRFCPWWMLPGWIVWKLGVYLGLAVRLRALGPYRDGLRDANDALPEVWRSRRPVSADAIFAVSGRVGPVLARRTAQREAASG